jgi:hypothetical protein
MQNKRQLGKVFFSAVTNTQAENAKQKQALRADFNYVWNFWTFELKMENN